jgi:hypothetical protein
VTTRSFGGGDLLAFAEVSGDHNPLHVDPVAARRTMTGEQTMHGVLGTLWALDCALAGDGGPIALRRLKTTFKRAVRAGEPVDCETTDAAAGTPTKALVAAGGRVHFEVEVAWAHASAAGDELPKTGASLTCRELNLEQAATQSGTLPLYVDVAALARLVPHVARRLPPRQLAFILATTRLVGMECPGLHSLYAGLDLQLEGLERDSALRWQVSAADRRHSRLLLDVTSGGMRGQLVVFMRPPPVRQLGMDEAAQLVRAGEFAGQRVLVVGGSRGLGEVSAKLVAAGGGDVLLTYHTGQADAARVVDEIRATGATATAAALDVLHPSELGTRLAGWIPTDLYYFATGHIDFGKPGAFSTSLFRRQCDYYVDGFAGVRAVLRAAAPSAPLRVLYPSSLFIDSAEPGAAEYAAAKAAGETLCAQLARQLGDVWHAPRLPRLRTDQTANVLGLACADPGPAVLAALRTLRDQARD